VLFSSWIAATAAFPDHGIDGEHRLSPFAEIPVDAGYVRWRQWPPGLEPVGCVRVRREAAAIAKTAKNLIRPRIVVLLLALQVRRTIVRRRRQTNLLLHPANRSAIIVWNVLPLADIIS